MILKTEKFQESCKKILDAVDSNVLSVVSETLELKTEGNILFMNVTNKEYFVEVKIDLETALDFHATVDANLFLNLISKITTKDIELTVVDNTLVVKGNGTYKIPLIYDGDKLLELPRIVIENEVKSFNVQNSILQSILKYNIKELQKGAISKPIQRLFYIDEKGAITFTTGACVNTFTLEQPLRMLLNERVVKLFKLLSSDTVQFKMGMDPLNESMMQTKVMFKDDSVTITAIISSDSQLMNTVPVDGIRNRADYNYPYSVTVDKNNVLEALGRMLVFTKKNEVALFTTIDFDFDGMTMYDNHKENKEKIAYTNYVDALEGQTYTALFEVNDLKLTLESCDEQYITIKFGNHQAAVISRASISNIIPECTAE